MKKTLFSILTILFFVITSNGQNINEQLYESIVKNDKVQVAHLLKNSANANYIKSSGPWMKVSMLITAVNNNNFDIVKLLIENKADVNWKDGFQTTALMYAASKGNKDISILLLDNGADINASDGQGNTVLSAAKVSNNKELIKYIQDLLKARK